MTAAQASADNARLVGAPTRSDLRKAKQLAKQMESNEGRAALGMPPLLPRSVAG